MAIGAYIDLTITRLIHNAIEDQGESHVNKIKINRLSILTSTCNLLFTTSSMIVFSPLVSLENDDHRSSKFGP